MNPLRKIYPTPWAVVVLPFILLFCSHAHAASDALTENFYARAGGGVYFLDMSESSPFIRTNGKEEVVGFPRPLRRLIPGRTAGQHGNR